MAFWESDFESDPDGQSPPTGMLKEAGLDNFEVDDVRAKTGTKSLWINEAGEGWEYGRREMSFTNELVVQQVYCINNAHRYPLRLEDAAGVSGTGNLVNAVYFQSTGDIKVYDGAVLTDTGANYTLSAWKELKMQCNFTAKTVDVWYNEILIADDYDFFNAGSTSIEAIHFGANGVTVSPCQFWLDDIQIGETAGWSGNFNGRLNPPNINGRVKNEVQKANGVLSA